MRSPRGVRHRGAVSSWPENWRALVDGHGCLMCETRDVAEPPGGVRFFAGQYINAYLGRWPVRRGYAYAVWRGRHVSEPTDLTPAESAGFWAEVARAASAVERRYEPAKMNWLILGNGVPHLHVHLVPRPTDDPHAGGPIESDAFDRARQSEIAIDIARAEAGVLANFMDT
jgi:diadenosine tetraphosphate (Ap4A) HIT family hydrolase